MSNKLKKLRFCNYSLLAITILTLLSSIQLEATGSSSALWVWIHMLVATIFLGLTVWHISLHFKSNWISAVFHGRKGAIKVLTIIGIIVVISAITATVHWFLTGEHSPVGAVHGKIGFLFLLLITIHAIKHHKFYTTR